jgi:F-type H+-transporting ATPase subunit b
MLIDWFTVGAQALNFVILVWLMRHFLYKPIVHAIDAREQRIAKALADADATRLEAQKARDEFQHKNETFDRQRVELFKRAADEARAEHDRLFEIARQAAEVSAARRREALRNDAHSLEQAIRLRTQTEVFSIARRALTDLASTSLEKRLVEVFNRRLADMDDRAKALFAEALTRTAEPALVRSAFDLPIEQRVAIREAVKKSLSAEVGLRFETEPSLIGGIELIKDGQKVAWTIADYLSSLESRIGDLSSTPAPGPENGTERSSIAASHPNEQFV